MSNRNLRVSELLKREISDVLHTRFQSEMVAVTVTGVDVAPDHRQAKVFYSVIGEEAVHAAARRDLDRYAGRVRYELGRRITLKNIPALEFVADASIERGFRLNEIIDALDADAAPPDAP